MVLAFLLKLRTKVYSEGQKKHHSKRAAPVVSGIGFIKRNPKVRLRNARPLDKKRAKISAAHADNWFAEYKQFMIETRLDTRPGQIWNCDETGFDLQGKAGKVLGPSEPKDQPYRVITGTKEHVTVLPCFS